MIIKVITSYLLKDSDHSYSCCQKESFHPRYGFWYLIAINQQYSQVLFDNSLAANNIAVSAKHARIDSVATTFILTDLQSTNGTFVNDQLISSHGMEHNDNIHIGKHELVFDSSDLEQKVAASNNDNLTDDKARILDTAEYRELINNMTGKVTPCLIIQHFLYFLPLPQGQGSFLHVFMEVTSPD